MKIFTKDWQYTILSLEILKEFLSLFDSPVLKPSGNDVVPETVPVIPGMGERRKKVLCAAMSFLLEGDHDLGKIHVFL